MVEEMKHNDQPLRVEQANELVDTSIEEWVFTLEDETTITKKVVVHD